MWAKEDNQQYRNLIKEHQSPDQIIQLMGEEKLRQDPKKRYFEDPYLIFNAFQKSSNLKSHLYYRKAKNSINLEFFVEWKISEKNYRININHQEDVTYQIFFPPIDETHKKEIFPQILDVLRNIQIIIYSRTNRIPKFIYNEDEFSVDLFPQLMKDSWNEEEIKTKFFNYQNMILHHIHSKEFRLEGEDLIEVKNINYIDSTKFDYEFSFQTNAGYEYILNFIYFEDFVEPYSEYELYNISFTTEENLDPQNLHLYTKNTERREIIELTERILFLINKGFIQELKKEDRNPILVIPYLENSRKLNFFRKLILPSLQNVRETLGPSSQFQSKKAYYYEVMGNKLFFK